MDPVLSSVSIVDEGSDPCCGTQDCHHTIIQHGSHTGWLADGKLRCRTRVEEALFQCSLDISGNCELVTLLDGHSHGPHCGHELVPHGNHYDYLVGGQLQHVVSTDGCCQRQCLNFLQPGAVVDHGHVEVLRGNTVGPRARVPYRQLKDVEDVKVHEEDEDPKLYKMDGIVTTYIYAAGICCPSEVAIIDKMLKPLPGVDSVDTMVVTKTVKVVHDASKVAPSALVAALNGAGLQAVLGAKGGKTGPQKTPIPWHVMASGALLILSLMSLINHRLEETEYLALGAVVFGIPGVLLKSFFAVRKFTLDINVLMVIAVAGAIGIDEYQEAGAIVFLFGFAEYLETKCMGRARNAVCSLLEMQPDTAMSATTGRPVPIEEVQVGDELIVRPGDRVPVDAIVLEGKTTLDESMLTGESQPVLKAVDSEVTSGTINCGNASLRISARSSADDSTVATLAKLVEQASLQKSNTARLVERFSKIYTPVVALAAVAIVLVPAAIRVDNLDDWIYLALVLLVTACPCAMVISTPVTTVCGISRAAKQGILIKGGKYLEGLAHIKAITFDKTGTLTEGQFQVIAVEKLGEKSKEEVLEYAAEMELHSTHPLGPAIVGCAAARGVTVKNDAVGVENIPGLGISGVMGDQSVRVGNIDLMRKCVPDADLNALRKLEDVYVSQGASLCFVCVESDVIGAIAVADTLREDARVAIGKMHARKLVVGMLTGDRQHAAKLAAEKLDIPVQHTHAELLPQDKLDKVAEYKTKYGYGAHVGDGINDTLALARADVGIAMGIVGSAMAVEAADVALFSNDLVNLVLAVDIGSRVHWKILQNIVFAISVKAVVIVLASVGWVQLWVAVIADVGSSVLVIMNGITLLSYKLNSTESTTKSTGQCVRGKTSWNPAEELLKVSNNIKQSLIMVSQGPIENSSYPSEGGGHCRSESAVPMLEGLENSFDHFASGSQPVAKVPCAKGCCSTKKRRAAEQSVVKEPCSKGCCSTEKMSAAEQSIVKDPCAKGGCGVKEASAAEQPVVKELCGKGCCGTKKMRGAEQPVVKDSCGKGCCGAKKASAVEEPIGKEPCARASCGTKKASAVEEPIVTMPCAKGCCGAKKISAAEQPVVKESCGKGCCGTKKASAAEQPIVKEPQAKGPCGAKKTSVAEEPIVKEPCAKGCCGAKKTGAAEEPIVKEPSKSCCKKAAAAELPVIKESYTQGCCGEEKTQNTNVCELPVAEPSLTTGHCQKAPVGAHFRGLDHGSSSGEHTVGTKRGNMAAVETKCAKACCGKGNAHRKPGDADA
eukprot:evm.model.scf_588.1 EVM.evm.TU.scf_588.1   scf_588:5120-12616(-)